MQTKDHFKTGTTGLQDAVTPITSMGAHTVAANILPGGLHSLGASAGSNVGSNHGAPMTQPGQRRF